jgi:hypothetical protein
MAKGFNVERIFKFYFNCKTFSALHAICGFRGNFATGALIQTNTLSFCPSRIFLLVSTVEFLPAACTRVSECHRTYYRRLLNTL